MDGAAQREDARSWLPFGLGVIGVLVLVGLLVVALGLGGDDGEGGTAGDEGGAGDAAVDGEGAEDAAAGGRRSEETGDGSGPPTSAARGPEGTRELTEVPDEIPAGLLPDDARAIEGTVARGGDNWSAVVVFRSDTARSDLEQGADAAMAAGGFTRRDAVEDSERRVIRYDGEDGAVLTVTLRREGEEVVVGAVLVSGGN